MVHHTKKEHVNIFIMYGLSVCLVVILSLLNLISPKDVAFGGALQNDPAIQSSPVFNKQAFSGIETEAKAYIVYDVMTKEVIASKNETLQLPLASITKVMTAITSTLHKKKTDIITIRDSSIEDGYDLGLKKNQEWPLIELLKYTLVFSSNDGAEAVADSVGKEKFITLMNTDASTFGLTAFFTDPAGRDINGRIGGTGTVLDVAKLFAIARKNIPEVMDATTRKRSTMLGGEIRGIPNTNQEVETLPGAEASKTGYTDLAGGNLGIIVDVTLGHPVVIVVLGSTKEGRFNDVDILYKALRRSAEISTLP